MPLTVMVAKAGVLRGDGKCFTANTLKMFAEEAPEKYYYNEKNEELWLRKKPKEKPNAYIS